VGTRIVVHSWVEPFATSPNVLSKHQDCLFFPDNINELVGRQILRSTDNGTWGNGVGNLPAFLEEESNRRASIETFEATYNFEFPTQTVSRSWDEADIYNK
jgi:hypothetical protein